MPETPAISVEDLAGPVRRLLDAPEAEIVTWTAEPLAYQDFGGGSRSLRRVAGTARVARSPEPVAWSLVAKTFTPDSEDNRSSNDPADYAYWRREALLYGSGLLDAVPSSLRPARCYGVDARPASDVVWLEDLRDAQSGAWPVSRFEVAARHLGQFNGWWLAGREVPREPWLAQLESVQEFWTVHPAPQPGLWALRDAERWAQVRDGAGFADTPEPVTLRTFLGERPRYLTALRRLPQTLCHNDAMLPNLFAVHGADGAEETVAIDWQLAGPAPAGAELALLVAGSVMFLRAPGDWLDELDRRAIDGCLAGLADAGANVDEGEVRFAYAASTVLRMTAIVASWALNLANVVRPDDREWSEEFWRRPAEELAAHWGPLVGFLEQQATRARRWVAEREE